MKVHEASEIRNVAVIGHGGAGKTSLVSALLFDAGAVNRLGKVDDGTTITDFDEVSVARRKSVSAALCHLEFEKAKVNLMDTPGYGAFLHETRRREDARGAVWTPAVALTAYDDTAHLMRAGRAGFQRHLGKPVHPHRPLRTAAELPGRAWRRSAPPVG